MKTRKHCSLVLAAVLSTGALGMCNTPAADVPAANGPGLLHMHFEHAKQLLGLTDEQVVQIKTILASEKDNLTGVHSQLRDAHTALRAAIHAPDADEASVRAASAKMATAITDLALERWKLCRQISPILTPEQRQKIQEFLGHADTFLERILTHASGNPAE